MATTDLSPAAGGGALAPSRPATNLPDHLSNGAGNSASREVARRPGTGIAYSLAAYSNLDELCVHLTQLNAELGVLLDTLQVLRRSSQALQDTIANVDELAQFYEATAMTRSATDADSVICVVIDELVDAAQQDGFTALHFNALAFEGLAAIRASQDRMRAQGAGPRLLASAGRA